jgi:hypothetical protein
MPILGILLSGEERIMIRRVTMAIWEREHPLALELTELTENFLLRILIRVTIIPKTGGK